MQVRDGMSRDVLLSLSGRTHTLRPGLGCRWPRGTSVQRS